MRRGRTGSLDAPGGFDETRDALCTSSVLERVTRRANGEEGVAHRIDSVAASLAAGMTVAEVGDLDFGYAPPFGPVWDPVLGVAKVLEGDVS